MRKEGTVRSAVILIVVVAAIEIALFFALRYEREPAAGPGTGEYRYLKWHDDGSADLITFEDQEVIRLTKQQLGTMFGRESTFCR